MIFCTVKPLEWKNFTWKTTTTLALSMGHPVWGRSNLGWVSPAPCYWNYFGRPSGIMNKKNMTLMCRYTYTCRFLLSYTCTLRLALALTTPNTGNTIWPSLPSSLSPATIYQSLFKVGWGGWSSPEGLPLSSSLFLPFSLCLSLYGNLH